MNKKIILIDKRINDTIRVKQSFEEELKKKILKASDAIIKVYKKKGKMLIIGNGGSAADAQHLEAELVGRFLKEREPMDVTALTTNTSVITALVNDYPAELFFARQVKAHIGKGDLLFAISTSGNSLNILKGIEEAKNKGALVIGLTGETGGKMATVCDILLNVPSTETPRIQESHIFIIHLICEFVENAIAENE